LPNDNEIFQLLNVHNMQKLLCTVKERNITYKKHFLFRLETRSKQNSFIPTDIKEFKKMVINRYPTLVIYENEDAKFQVYYNLNEEYDLIVILAIMHIRKPVRIRFITLYPQSVYDRIEKYGRE
jgi:hypothetical protein